MAKKSNENLSENAVIIRDGVRVLLDQRRRDLFVPINGALVEDIYSALNEIAKEDWLKSDTIYARRAVGTYYNGNEYIASAGVKITSNSTEFDLDEKEAYFVSIGTHPEIRATREANGHITMEVFFPGYERPFTLEKFLKIMSQDEIDTFSACEIATAGRRLVSKNTKERDMRKSFNLDGKK